MLPETAETRPPLSTFQYIVLPQLFLALVIAVRPSATWRLLAFLLMAFVNLKALSFTSGNPDIDNALGSVFGTIIYTSLYLLFLVDPTKDFRHKKDLVTPSDLPLPRKVYWALCVQNALRGIGWNYRVPNIAPSSHEPRWSFVMSQCRRALRYLFIIDAAQTYIHANPVFSHSTNTALSLGAQGYVFRSINVITYMGRIYCLLQLQYTLLAIFCVAVGLSESGDCPPLFGNWRDSYTLRRFWGRTWHQMLRRYFASIGKSLAGWLGFQPGSNLSSYTQLYAAFIISATQHLIGDIMVGKGYTGWSFQFYLAQAVAITAEDAMIALARRAGINKPTSITRIIGYIWVFVWFTAMMPPYVDSQVAAGLHVGEPFPISPTSHAVRMLNETIDVDLAQIF